MGSGSGRQWRLGEQEAETEHWETAPLCCSWPQFPRGWSAGSLLTERREADDRHAQPRAVSVSQTLLT